MQKLLLDKYYQIVASKIAIDIEEPIYLDNWTSSLVYNYSNQAVYEYIKDHPSFFNRSFFEALIIANQYATSFETNCFTIMPLEYIDEAMCSLAMIKSIDYSENAWFYTVKKRKPEALTSNLYKLGARLYAFNNSAGNNFLTITPEEYQDEDYFLEMCSSNYNNHQSLQNKKGNIMESIPSSFLTPSFLKRLIDDDLENIIRFTNKALETILTFDNNGLPFQAKIWQYAISKDGNLINYIDLTDERIAYFLSIYAKDSFEYFNFKARYKAYKKAQDNPQDYAKLKERIESYYESHKILPVFYSLSEEDPIPYSHQNKDKEQLLPIIYVGPVPNEYKKEYDSEEYLALIYQKLGIKIIEQYDDLFYLVHLPNNLSIKNEYYYYELIDETGNVIIDYFYDSKIYDRKAYVTTINPQITLTDNSKTR